MSDFFVKNWLIIVICMSVYFLPTFISLFNPKGKSFGIFLFNFLFGWTIIMWISLFFEAFRDPSISRYNETEDDYPENNTSQKNAQDTSNVVNEFSKFTSTKAFEVWFRNLK